MKSIFETLAALSAGAVLITGCGASPAPVNATEVPAASDAKPSTPAAAQTAAAMQAAPPAAPAPAPAAAPAPSSTAKAVASAAPSAKPTAAPAAKPKKKASAGTKDTGSCGAGTCG